MTLFEIITDVIGIFRLNEVLRTRDRVEVHGLQIGEPDLMTDGVQGFDRRGEHGCVERMLAHRGANDQDFHTISLFWRWHHGGIARDYPSAIPPDTPRTSPVT